MPRSLKCLLYTLCVRVCIEFKNQICSFYVFPFSLALSPFSSFIVKTNKRYNVDPQTELLHAERTSIFVFSFAMNVCEAHKEACHVLNVVFTLAEQKPKPDCMMFIADFFFSTTREMIFNINYQYGIDKTNFCQNGNN